MPGNNDKYPEPQLTMPWVPASQSLSPAQDGSNVDIYANNLLHRAEKGRLAVIEEAEEDQTDDRDYFGPLLPMVAMDHAVADQVRGKIKKSAIKRPSGIHDYDLFSAALSILKQSESIDDLKTTDIATFRTRHPDLVNAFADIVTRQQGSQQIQGDVQSVWCIKHEHQHAEAKPKGKSVHWNFAYEAPSKWWKTTSQANYLDTSGLLVDYQKFYSGDDTEDAVEADIADEDDFDINDVEYDEQADLDLERGIREALEADYQAEHNEVSTGAADTDIAMFDSFFEGQPSEEGAEEFDLVM